MDESRPAANADDWTKDAAWIPAPPDLAAPPLRLAFVSHCLRPCDHSASRIGGAERAAAELLAALLRQPGATVIPLVADAASDRLGFVRFAVAALARLRRLAEAQEIDAVLFSALPTAWMTALLAPVFRRNGVATAAICHGHDVIMDLEPYQSLVRRTFAGLDAVLPVSRATGDACLARGLDPRRMHVLPNGVDAARFAAPARPQDRRAILAAAFPEHAGGLSPRDGLVVCTVGRQVPRKGHAWFVRTVMPRLPADVQFWLVGDGPEASSIAAAAREAGMTDRVRRLGALSEAGLAALYRGCDLFVMPNVPTPGDMEGFGLVMLEANLNGLPAIAADLEGIADVVATGVNGRLIRAGDGEAFAAAILELRRDPDLRHLLGRQAEAHARGFGWDAVAASQLGILATARRAPAGGLAKLSRESAMPGRGTAAAPAGAQWRR